MTMIRFLRHNAKPEFFFPLYLFFTSNLRHLRLLLGEYKLDQNFSIGGGVEGIEQKRTTRTLLLPFFPLFSF